MGLFIDFEVFEKMGIVPIEFYEFVHDSWMWDEDDEEFFVWESVKF